MTQLNKTMTAAELDAAINEIKVEDNPCNGGLCASFIYDSKEYWADMLEFDVLVGTGIASLLPYTTECQIFEAENGVVTNWSELYTNRNIPLTEQSLRECILDFVTMER